MPKISLWFLVTERKYLKNHIFRKGLAFKKNTVRKKMVTKNTFPEKMETFSQEAMT